MTMVISGELETSFSVQEMMVGSERQEFKV